MESSSGQNRGFYVINEDVLATGLKGNELLVYALVRSYVAHGQTFSLTASQIMERTNIDSRRGVMYILQRLCGCGLLVKVGQERTGRACEYTLGCAKNAHAQNLHMCKNCTPTCAKFAQGVCKNCTPTCAKNAHPHNNVYNTENNTDNTDINPSPLRVREEKVAEMRAGIMEGWRDHYKDVTGEEYLLARGSIVAEVADIMPIVERLMEVQGKETTEESVREFCIDLFRELRGNADKWQLDHWSLHTITTQINELKQKKTNGNNNERPRKIADASQFVDRL